MKQFSSNEEITLKELYSFLIHRIYHEDNLLQQRNDNFFTVNVFLAAGFAVAVATEPTRVVQVSVFGYVLVTFGFFWALLQVAYGKKQVTATNFWRSQVWMAEKALHTKFDYTLFEFYDYGKTETPFGVIKMSSKLKKPPNKSFPYTFPFLSGANELFAVTVPWMVSAFWAALMIILLLNNQAPLIGVLLPVAAVMVSLLVISLFGRVTYSEGMIDEHTLPSTAQDRD